MRIILNFCGKKTPHYIKRAIYVGRKSLFINKDWYEKGVIL